jgi:hypothetical protein
MVAKSSIVERERDFTGMEWADPSIIFQLHRHANSEAIAPNLFQKIFVSETISHPTCPGAPGNSVIDPLVI